MKDYRLYHDPTFGGGTTVGLLEAALPSNRMLASTAEKIRAGITRKGAGSPGPDIASGGGQYVFTRIRNVAPGSGSLDTRPGIYFKQRNLARLDAISYGGDKYGQTLGDNYVHSNRASDVDGWKAYSRDNPSGNETIFKHGLHLLEEMDYLRAESPSHRLEILAVFKKNGIANLPDGRKIEDVIL
jgi:hypothetical protein